MKVYKKEKNMFNIELKLLDSHFSELEKRVKELSKSSSFVGYDDTQAPHKPSGLPLPSLVGILSAGYDGMAPRPVFDYAHMTFKFKDSSMRKDLEKYLSNIKNKSAPITVDKINEGWAKDMSDEVISIFGSSPPLEANKQSTQDRKGGRNTPLVDSGYLRDHLGYIISDDPIKLTKNLG